MTLEKPDRADRLDPPQGEAPAVALDKTGQSDLPTRLRVVCDTNVLVSAMLFPRSIPGQAITHARHAGRLLTTPVLATELRDVLTRPKFARYITAEIRDEFLAAYLAETEFVVVTEHVKVCRDPKDDSVLDAAVNGDVTCVLSDDDDLLVLSPFRNIPILRPAEYLARFGSVTS